MNRRDFLKSSTARKKHVYVRHFQGTQTGLETYSGPFTNEHAAHLLRRTMFGASKAHIDQVISSGMSAAVDDLLLQVPSVSPPIREYGPIVMDDGMYEDPNVAKGSTWVNDLNKIEDGNLRAAVFNRRCESLRKWWMGVIANQQFGIAEKMVLFWHHHFSVQKEEVEHPIMLYRHLMLLRQHALGNVKDLTAAVTIDPAMLIHLNGYLNSKVAPDENYARELQELFTVGKGENSLYTEEDVMQAARVLTGWRVDRDSLEVTVDSQSHDDGSKSFSSFYGNASIAGSADARAELDALINLIFSNQECSLNICRKLYRWFVNSTIDPDTETNVIVPLAEIFRSAGFEIKPVLTALFNSAHFYDPVNMACYMKSPLDLVVGALREFNVSVPAYTDYANGYPVFQSLYNSCARMGMDLFQPPDVNGWPAYHQDPMFYEIWVNSNSLPMRADFTDGVFQDGLVDVRSIAALSTDPANELKLVEDMEALFLSYPLSQASRQYVASHFLLNNSIDVNRWKNAWNGNDAAVIVPSLRSMFRFMCNLPEYHLC